MQGFVLALHSFKVALSFSASAKARTCINPKDNKGILVTPTPKLGPYNHHMIVIGS